MKNSPVPAHILLVDDNPDGLLIRRTLLEEQGYLVDIASDGEKGLQLFLASNFDVIVTDYRMPQMNGVELIRRIREVRPEAAVVLLSGFVEPLGLTEESTGADSVIPKSAGEAAHLIRVVKRLLQPNRVRRKPVSSQPASPVSRARIRVN
jgi:CheY-like chemotaxis protein